MFDTIKAAITENDAIWQKAFSVWGLVYVVPES